ncbi:MAG: T9SS C-terminal target domain-containing protein, partial [Calditrichaeota bacterium]
VNMPIWLFDPLSVIEKGIDSETPDSFMVSNAGEVRTFVIKTGPDDSQATDKVPDQLTLDHPWPNPYRLSRGGPIKIRFGLPEESRIELRVFNILGQLVWRSTSNAAFSAGQHALIWNGRDFNGQSLVSGIYFVQLVNGVQIAQKKLIFVR